MNAAVCLDNDTLAALLESETPEAGAAYATHLDTCSRCRQTLADLAADNTSWEKAACYLPRLGDSTPSQSAAREPVLERLLTQLKKEPPFFQKAPEVPVEAELSLSFLRAADRPGLLGYLGAYEVQEVVGRGGMGLVLKAFDPALQRLVAIKVMAAAALLGSATARQRFAREAKAAAAVCHEHIVTVHGVHETDGLPYLVMQYIAGESLQARLDRTGALDVLEIVRIGMQTAAGLAAAHAQGLIHRDIKPANLLLENGLARVKITDFGLARMTDDVPLTQNGVVAGTPEYMAPEQARGETVDHRADLFSLGSVLYALCTGVPPFRAASAVAVLRQVSDETAAPIRSLNPEIPAWLEMFIARLLAKNPDERFQSAAEVVECLQAYLAHLQQPATVAAPFLPHSSPKDGATSSSSSRSRLVASLYRFWMPPLMLTVVLLGTWGRALWLGGQGVGGSPKQAQENDPAQPRRPQMAFDFRTGLEKFPALSLEVPDANTVAKTDAQGLRVTIPAGREDTRPVLLDLTQRLHGDFDITAGFELLAVGNPVPQYGAGVALVVQFDSPSSLTARLGRSRKPSGDKYGSLKLMDGPDGKSQYLNNMDSKASSANGKLRLVRNGSKVRYLVAEEGQDYKTLQVVEFGTADVERVQLHCHTMYAPISLDVRLTDLVIEADQIPGGLPPVQVTATVPAGASQARDWLLPAELLGALLLIGLSIGFGAWLYVRSSRRREEAPTEAVAAPVSFMCPACGKNLKAKPELAGKKVKCTQCGKPVPVLPVQVNQTGISSFPN